MLSQGGCWIFCITPEQQTASADLKGQREAPRGPSMVKREHTNYLAMCSRVSSMISRDLHGSRGELASVFNDLGDPADYLEDVPNDSAG